MKTGRKKSKQITRRDIEKIDNQPLRVGWTTGQGVFRVSEVILLNAPLGGWTRKTGGTDDLTKNRCIIKVSDTGYGKTVDR